MTKLLIQGKVRDALLAKQAGQRIRANSAWSQPDLLAGEDSCPAWKNN